MYNESINLMYNELMTINPYNESVNLIYNELSFRRDSRASNASGSTDCGVLSGQQSNQEIDPSIPSKFVIQSHGLSEGYAHGNYGAHNNSDEREWCHQEVPEGDGMEFDGTNEVAPSN